MYTGIGGLSGLTFCFWGQIPGLVEKKSGSLSPLSHHTSISLGRECHRQLYERWEPISEFSQSWSPAAHDRGDDFYNRGRILLRLQDESCIVHRYKDSSVFPVGSVWGRGEIYGFIHPGTEFAEY